MSGGRIAQEHGAEHESWLEDHHKEALRLGIVAGPIEHNEPHWRQINGRWERVAAGVADYTGVLHNGHATTLAVEAKCRQGRLYKHHVEPKQQQHLETVVRGGGVALLCVRIIEVTLEAELEQNFAVPWPEVRWKTLRSRECIEAGDLVGWKIPTDSKCYLDRFCSVRGVPAPAAVQQRRKFPRE